MVTCFLVSPFHGTLEPECEMLVFLWSVGPLNILEKASGASRGPCGGPSKGGGGTHRKTGGRTCFAIGYLRFPHEES